MSTFVTRTTLPRGKPVLVARDHAPTMGFSHTPSGTRTVHVTLVDGPTRWEVALNGTDALRAIGSWLGHGLGQGMFTSADLVPQLAGSVHVEHLVDQLLTQLPNSMVQRIFDRRRKDLDL
jgi:hypothetical protein